MFPGFMPLNPEKVIFMQFVKVFDILHKVL